MPSAWKRKIALPLYRTTTTTKSSHQGLHWIARRTNSSQRLARNLLPKMVSDDRPVYQEEHAAQLIMAERDCSPLEGRIHLRRPVDRPFAFSLQSRGGPYICRNYESLLR